MVVAVISIDAYLFLAFSDLTCHVEDTGIRFFLVALCGLIVRRLNLEVATKRLLHQQEKYWGSFSVMFAHGSVSLQLISGGVDISEVPACHLLQQMSSR